VPTLVDAPTELNDRNIVVFVLINIHSYICRPYKFVGLFNRQLVSGNKAKSDGSTATTRITIAPRFRMRVTRSLNKGFIGRSIEEFQRYSKLGAYSSFLIN